MANKIDLRKNKSCKFYTASRFIQYCSLSLHVILKIPITYLLLDILFSSFTDDLNEILPNEDSSLVPNISEVPTSSSSLELSSSPPPPFGDTGSKNSNQNNNKKKLLLPEKILPPSSGGEGALPIFLKEPSDTFLIKSRPATLHCRVAHALRVYFQCNSEAVEPTTIKNHVEPESGVRYTEASVDILRDKVEEYFSDYHCACVAISSKGSVISKKHALVAIACKFYLINIIIIFLLIFHLEFHPLLPDSHQ